MKKIFTTLLVVAMMATSVLRVSAAETKLTERNEFWYRITKDGGFVQKHGLEPIQVSSGIMALKQDNTGTGYAQIELKDMLEKGYLREISYEEQEEKLLLKGVFETFQGVVYEVELFIDYYDYEAELAAQKARAAEARAEEAGNSGSSGSGSSGSGSSGSGSSGSGSSGSGSSGSGSSGSGSSGSGSQNGGATPPPFGGMQTPTPPSNDIDGAH